MGTSFVQVPPDGAGKKLSTHEYVDVNGDLVHVQVMHISDHANHTNTLAIDDRGSASVRFSEGQPILSGFGALKVSNQRALGVYESTAGSYDDLFSITLENGGTNVYDDVSHGILLGVTGAAGSRCLRMTNRYHYYLPGSANSVVMTISCGDTGKVGNTRRWGAFDEQDGMFFALIDTTPAVVIRSSTSGSIVENVVTQANWNKDKLNGTGGSGITLDVTKINVWWLDYQWLGAGRVRFGIYAPDGSRIVCHQFENAGQNALPFTRTGTLPLATENINTAVTGSSSELRESCMAIYTEGTYDDWTYWRSADVNAESVVVGSTETTVVAFRAKALIPTLNHHNTVNIFPETLNIHCDQPFRLNLYKHVETSGGTWGNTGASSLIETSLNTTITPTKPVFKTWFFPAGTHCVDISQFFEVNDEGIIPNSDGTLEPWAFTAKRLGTTNATVTLNMGCKEHW